MSSKTIKGFIDQQNRRGVGVTPELMEHYEDMEYDELPWWKKWLYVDPREVRAERQFWHNEMIGYIRNLGKKKL